MKLRKVFVCMAAALVLMGTLFRPGVRVIVCGKVLPGVYDPAVAARCAASAHAAAEEICRGDAVGEYKLIPVLTRRWAEPQQLQLTRVLLESYEGVQRVYAIRAGSETMGHVDTPAEAYRLCMRYPALPIHMVPTYTYAPGDSLAAAARLETYAKNVTAPF